jgi:hypothetical protein
LQLRREQKKAHARAQQPALFELKDDRRPLTERTPAGHYQESAEYLDVAEHRNAQSARVYLFRRGNG